MTWLTALIAAFKAIPVISQDIRDIANFFRKAEENKWFDNNNKAFQPLEGPTTKEQKDEAAKTISDSISKL